MSILRWEPVPYRRGKTRLNVFADLPGYGRYLIERNENRSFNVKFGGRTVSINHETVDDAKARAERGAQGLLSNVVEDVP